MERKKNINKEASRQESETKEKKREINKRSTT